MKRHVEHRIIFLCDGDDAIDRVVEPRELDAKMWQLVVESERQHALGARAHRRGVQKRNGGGGIVGHGTEGDRCSDYIVIARSEATKQSKSRCARPLDCFASLAMTM